MELRPTLEKELNRRQAIFIVQRVLVISARAPGLKISSKKFLGRGRYMNKGSEDAVGRPVPKPAIALPYSSLKSLG